MRELNIEWRGENRAAKILSFPQGETPGPVRVLGDIAIRGDGPGYPDYLLVHGIMHLLGYRHDTDDEAEKMKKREKEILGLL